MGEAIRKESSMEDILASIRKIISSDTPEPASQEDTTNDELDSSADKNSLFSEASEPDLGSNILPDSAPVAISQAIKAEPTAKPKTQKTSMSSTLDGIRAAVGKKKPVEDAAIKAEPNSKSVSTSATPLAPSVSGKSVESVEPAKPVEKSDVSLADFADKLSADGAGDPIRDMNYAEPETKTAEIAVDAAGSKSTDNTSTPSEINFKAFASSVEKPANATKTPSEFINDDVAVFASDDEISVDISSAELRGPLDDTASDSSPAAIDVATTEPVPVPELEKTNSPINASISANIADSVRAAVRADTGASSSADKDLSVNQDAPHAEPATQTVGESSEFKEALVSPSTKAAVTGSINRLKQSMDDVNTAHVENVLRPMLREWLDSNLPQMVEKIVREEISQLTRDKTDV